MKTTTTKEQLIELIDDTIEEMARAFMEDMTEDEIENFGGEDAVYELVSSDTESAYEFVRRQLDEEDTQEFSDLFDEAYNYCS